VVEEDARAFWGLDIFRAGLRDIERCLRVFACERTAFELRALECLHAHHRDPATSPHLPGASIARATPPLVTPPAMQHSNSRRPVGKISTYNYIYIMAAVTWLTGTGTTFVYKWQPSCADSLPRPHPPQNPRRAAAYTHIARFMATEYRADHARPSPCWETQCTVPWLRAIRLVPVWFLECRTTTRNGKSDVR
jgi:hypothetical protein